MGIVGLRAEPLHLPLLLVALGASAIPNLHADPIHQMIGVRLNDGVPPYCDDVRKVGAQLGLCSWVKMRLFLLEEQRGARWKWGWRLV
ncbi:MAG: hypothetical protein EA397_05580 [Deltaproteobacteria bacterium]|nr:MAG: hypothetical protein EA397_05580 [Deltaproteobacteria bacterium]